MLLLGMPVTHMKVPGYMSQIHCQFQLPLNVHPQRQPLPATCETQIEFWALGSSLAQLCLLQALGEVNQCMGDLLPESLCLSHKIKIN